MFQVESCDIGPRDVTELLGTELRLEEFVQCPLVLADAGGLLLQLGVIVEVPLREIAKDWHLASPGTLVGRVVTGGDPALLHLRLLPGRVRSPGRAVRADCVAALSTTLRVLED